MRAANHNFLASLFLDEFLDKAIEVVKSRISVDQ